MKMNAQWKQTAIKVILGIGIVVYLVLLCIQGYSNDISLDNLQKRYEKQKLLSGMQEQKEKNLRRYYGIEAAQCEEYLYYKAESTMAVDELLIVKAGSAKEAKEMEKNAKNHLESQKKSFEGYGIEQTALLKKAEVGSTGKYVIYMAGEKASKQKKVFDEMVR